MNDKKRKLFDDDCEFVNASAILSAEFFMTEDHQKPITLVLTNKVVFFHLP